MDFAAKARLRLGRTGGRYLGGRRDAQIERGTNVVGIVRIALDRVLAGPDREIRVVHRSRDRAHAHLIGLQCRKRDGLDRHQVAVDVVSTSEVSVSLTVDSNQAIPALAADLAKLADVKYEGRKAIVCLVGENLRETPGIAALVFRELADKKIRMISQGASEINLTFVIEEDEVPEVIQRLHKTFFAELDAEVFA